MPRTTDGNEAQLRRIVVGHDFSAHSAHAYEEAIRWAEAFDAELVLVHALTSSVPPLGGEGGGAAAADPPYDEGGAQQKLEAVAAEARGRGVKVETVVRAGARAEDVLMDVAREQDASMVAVGTHGRTGVGRFLMGSVAEGVVRQSARPVLVVPAPDKDEAKARGVMTPEQRTLMGRPRI